MKYLLVLFGLFIFGGSTPVTLYREIQPEVWVAEKITDPLPSFTVDEDDIQMYFRNQDNGDDLILIDLNNSSSVTSYGFSAEKDTVFIVHGWLNQYNSEVCLNISNAILQVQDANVFIVDWSKIASGSYTVAQAAVASLGKIVGGLITKLINNNQLDLDKSFIAGHSLGAHVAGLAGAALDGNISYIVGLDPALPLFSYENTSNRLDSTDAKFVEVIHTCAGSLGFDQAIGSVDYWPNGGSDQPGCSNDTTGACSHGRSYLYYAESIVSGGFLGRKCDNYDDYIDGKCNAAATAFMGEYLPNRRASGNYYLTTNAQSPYGQTKL